MRRFMRPVLLGTIGSIAAHGAGGGTVAAKGHRFMAEIAATPQEQQKGLMFRQFLAKDRCMIFVFDEDGVRRIIMKNCLIALDVVWISVDGHVVEMAEKVPPCPPARRDGCPAYGGTVPARHFIEFAAGTIKRLGLKKGDRIGWDLKLDDGTPVVGGASIPREKAPAKSRRKPK
ncbi:MAG: DUF192 domain-containing protein [Holophagaceae bacterium]|nr:DUF192 domain-containing protein [Holophagaceae bacterium]